MGAATTSSPLGIPINGILCTVYVADGVVESVPDSGPQAALTYKCPWDQRYTVILGLKGGVLVAGTTIVQFAPHAYPNSPNLRCTAIGDLKGLRPYRDTTGMLQYVWALIPVIYSVPSWAQEIADQNPGVPAFTTIKYDTAPEVFSPPGGAFYMPALGKTPVAESTVGIIRPHCQVTMTRDMLPYFPLDADQYFQGTVNAGSIQFADHTFARGTLMYVGASGDPKADPSTGNQIYSAAFKFMGSPMDFNMFLGRDGGWHLLNTKPDGSGNPPFAYQDFSWFFGSNLAAPGG